MVMFWSRSAWSASIRLAHSKGMPRRRAMALELLELAVRQGAGVVEQPADQGGLAVVHVADDHDLELFGRAGAVGARRWSRSGCWTAGFVMAADRRVGWTPSHMYPSRRSFSKASSLSWSCARPERSEVLRGAQFLDDLAHGAGVGLDRDVHGAQPRLR